MTGPSIRTTCTSTNQGLPRGLVGHVTEEGQHQGSAIFSDGWFNEPSVKIIFTPDWYYEPAAKIIFDSYFFYHYSKKDTIEVAGKVSASTNQM